MGDDVDATASIMNLLPDPPSSPQLLSQPAGQESDRTLEDILARASTDLIDTFAASIRQGTVKEDNKDEEFRQEFKRRLFRAIIGTYVWTNARLSHETQSGEGRLAEGVQGLLSLARDQGRSSPPPTMMDRLRVRLCELMAAVSRAVEMFGQF